MVLYGKLAKFNSVYTPPSIFDLVNHCVTLRFSREQSVIETSGTSVVNTLKYLSANVVPILGMVI